MPRDRPIGPREVRVAEYLAMGRRAAIDQKQAELLKTNPNATYADARAALMGN